MNSSFAAIGAPVRLHASVTRALARRVLESDDVVLFPKEADLCRQLGVSRTILRESMKVLADKGMVEMKPRAGTRSRPRSAWRLLDPDILTWQAEAHSSPDFLRDLCEVRLAIEPTAAGFAAVRATNDELNEIERLLDQRGRPGASVDEVVGLDLDFHAAVVRASHNPLLTQLSDVIRSPIRIALASTARYPAAAELELHAHRTLLESLRRRDPAQARRAAEEVVGFAMLAVEKVIRAQKRAGSRKEPARTAGR